MSYIELIAIFLGTLFLFLGSGVWVAISLIACAIIGMELFTNRPTGDAMTMTMWASMSSWTLTSLPLFIWMGEILLKTKISETLFKGLAPWMARLPGGLLHTNVVGSAFFAAISGSSAATAATVGRMSIPELRKANYPEDMIIGTLAGASTLGLLIPPSIALIVYGVTTNQSISQLFVAGILPGIMLAIFFMLYIVIKSFFFKHKEPVVTYTWREKFTSLLSLTPVMGLIISVIGSIYMGLATPTEAAVLGVVGSLIIAKWQKTLTRSTFYESLLGALKTSCMIAFILMGAQFLTLTMGFTGLPRNLAEMVGALNLTPLLLIVVLTAFYIILGCFLDGLSSIVLTMAVVEPLVRQAGFDMIWFGIYLVVVIEMAQITPPVGFNLFVLQSMTGKDIGFIAKASLPMFLLMIFAVMVLFWQPWIVTFLPNLMR
ncbi:TRAP transporter large permease subunit [Vreelandella glaciei]|uniref:TRAP transporter large permease n=1 Tax=Vreelandella glaciei TaxID=186761 RepID=UPI0030EF4C91|tara:strand:+ start:5834 stop:7126 length:1293 start_codon:yes stop_codon:yes gene_type:complete